MSEITTKKETYSEMRERQLMMNINDMTNICHYVDDYVQNYCSFDSTEINDVKKMLLHYEFSKLQEEVEEMNLYEQITSVYNN